RAILRAITRIAPRSPSDACASIRRPVCSRGRGCGDPRPPGPGTPRWPPDEAPGARSERYDRHPAAYGTEQPHLIRDSPEGPGLTPGFPKLCLELPDWIGEFVRPDDVLANRDDRMRLAIRLAAENVARGTGGPFGAAVFERETGRIGSVGVNVVVPSACSL